MTQQRWTPEQEAVVERFRDAAGTVRRLPRVKGPSTGACAWPEVVQDARDAYGYTSASLKLPAPSPRAIDRMDEVFTWFRYFEGRDEMKVVWLVCGLGFSLREAARILGCGKSTVRRHVWVAVNRVIEGLSKEQRRVAA